MPLTVSYLLIPTFAALFLHAIPQLLPHTFPRATLPLSQFLSQSCTMARKTDEDGLLARADANGYRKGAHREEDTVRDRNKHIEKTKKDQTRRIRSLCPIRKQRVVPSRAYRLTLWRMALSTHEERCDLTRASYSRQSHSERALSREARHCSWSSYNKGLSPFPCHLKQWQNHDKNNGRLAQYLCGVVPCGFQPGHRHHDRRNREYYQSSPEECEIGHAQNLSFSSS